MNLNSTVNFFQKPGGIGGIAWVVLGITFANPSLAQWQQTGGPKPGAVTTLVSNDNTLYAAAFDFNRNSLYKSVDGGQKWTSINAPGLSSAAAVALAAGRLYAGGESGLFYSTTDGSSWSSVPALNNKTVRALFAKGSLLLAGTETDAIFRSIDNGTTWSQTGINLPNWGMTSQIRINAFASCGATIFCAVNSRNGETNVFRSVDNGANWLPCNIPTGQVALQEVAFAVNADAGGRVYASTNRYVYQSLDTGKTWNQFTQGIDAPFAYAASFLAVGNSFFAGVTSGSLPFGIDYSSAIYRLDGDHWVKVLAAGPPPGKPAMALAALGNVIVAGTVAGVYQSADAGEHWTPISFGLPGSARTITLLPDGVNMFAGTYFGDSNLGIYKTSDKGQTWTSSNGGAPDMLRVEGLHRHNAYLFAGADGGGQGGIFRSADNGQTWANYPPLASDIIFDFASVGDVILAGSYGFGVVRSLDNGNSWDIATTGMLNGSVGYALTTIGDTFFVGSNSGIYRSADKGNHWTRIKEVAVIQRQLGIKAAGSVLYATYFTTNPPIDEGTYRSLDNGDTWTKIHPVKFAGLAAWGNMVVACLTDQFGTVIASIDNGDHWTSFGRIGNWANDMALWQDYVFVGAENGIWRRPFSDFVITEVTRPTDESDRLRVTSFPNPFQTSTTLSFHLPEKSMVSILVMDLFGREVANLLSEELPAGDHAREWNAAGVPAGIFFCQVRAGKALATRRLVVAR